MKRFFHAVGLVFVVLWLWHGDSALAAAPRIALVIGNSAYEIAPPLANPANDAKLIAETLRGLGFDVVERIDADRKTILLAAFDLRRRLKAAGEDAIGLFFYAGHGVQVAGENYIIPLGAEFKQEREIPAKAVSASFVLQMMETADNRVNFFILDASHNNPFPASSDTETRGLARMSPLTGSLIAYSTGPGIVAADGAGANSPYVLALTEAMQIPGITAELMFKRVRESVLEATNDAQTPWDESSLKGAGFYFSDDVTLTAAEKEARRLAEAEARRLAAEEEARRQAEAEAETQRLAAEEEVRRQTEAEAEVQRLAAEEETRRLAAAEAQSLAAEEEVIRQAEAEAEAQRLAAEEEARRQAVAAAEAAAEAQRLADEEEVIRQAEAEAEVQRLAAEEEARRLAAAEAQSPAAEEVEVATLVDQCEDPLQRMFVNTPGADVPKAMARFSGIWEGKWGGVLCSSLAVTSVDKGGMVKVVYSWGSGKNFGAGMWPYNGVIIDGKLRFGERSRSVFVFYVNDEGDLEGTRESEGLKAFVRMRKCPPTKCL